MYIVKMKGSSILSSLKEESFSREFSHIYVEERAKGYLVTQNILKRFPNSKVIYINHYKDVFSRSHQDFVLQKKSPMLILAVKEDNFIYEGATPCDSFDNDNFYYTSSMMNCIYDCEYCYLQGMYSSSNIVIFVNIEDILGAVEELLKKHPVYLCISYESDMMALEGITGYCRRWIEFAKKHKDIKIELRTKSSNYASICDLKPCENFILAWTLSPEKVDNCCELRAPSLEQRISSISAACRDGWKVRLCFDPIIYIDGWKEQYKNMVEKIFSVVDPKNINDISIGVFRVSKDFLKIMRKGRPSSLVLNYPFEIKDGMYSYGDELTREMAEYVYDVTSKYVKKIYMNI